MEKKERFSPPAVGGSSLLVIFAILCLTVFAILSLSTVQAEQRLADASIEAVSEYYAADCMAEEIFARLRAGEQVEGVERNGNEYQYECPVSEAQWLHVTLMHENGAWKILGWQMTAKEQEAEEELLDLWDGL